MVHNADHFLFLGQFHKRSCKLPHCTIPEIWGLLNESRAPGSVLSINVSGTECYDVSSMGTGKGLNGPTSKSLAIWIQQRKRSKEAGLLTLLGKGFAVICVGSNVVIVGVVWWRSSPVTSHQCWSVLYQCGVD